MNLARAIEQAQAANEQKVVAGIQVPIQFDSNAELRLANYNRFCAQHGLRNLGSPKIVAAWVRSERGTEPNKIIETLSAIELLHDAHGLSNPVATSVVRAELEKALQIEPPRSWPRHDQLRFAALPVETRGIIAKRERDRERWLRNKQNELAELKRQLTDGAAKPVTNTKETENVTQAK